MAKARAKRAAPSAPTTPRVDPEGIEESDDRVGASAYGELVTPMGAVRRDPDSERGPMEQAWAEVVNGRSDMYYVRVPKTGPSRFKYEALGYSYVRQTEGGPRSRTGEVDPDSGFVEMMDTYLMCIPKTEKARIDLEGWDGTGGQRAVTRIEKKMDSRKYAEGLKPVTGMRDGQEVEYFRFEQTEG